MLERAGVVRFRLGRWAVRLFRPRFGPTRFGFDRTPTGFVLSLRWLLIRGSRG